MEESNGNIPRKASQGICATLLEPTDTSPLSSSSESSVTAHFLPSKATSLKRRLRSESPECVIYEILEEQYREKPWKRPRKVVSEDAPTEWPGRGRSPVKTPVTTVIDQIKWDSQALIQLEQALEAERASLRILMAARSDEIASTASRRRGLANPSLTELTNQTRLPPPSPTSRSQSPSRQILRDLPLATPPVIVSELGELDVSEDVIAVLQLLRQGCRERYIPQAFRDRLERDSKWFNADDRAWDHRTEYNEKDLEMMWGKAKKIQEEAHQCQKWNKDENAWSMEVVQRVLRYESGGAGCPPFTRLENIQTQAIDKDFLPIWQNNTFTYKKADYALSFSNTHPDLQPVYQELQKQAVARHLSQMDDKYTGELAMLAGVEVKRSGGNGQDAQAQLFLWLAAGIISLRLLRTCRKEGSYATTRLPLVGWTVVGHIWEIYIAVERDACSISGAVDIIGPITGANGDTRTIEGVFKLIKLVKVVKQYGQDLYWPWLKHELIDVLS